MRQLNKYLLIFLILIINIILIYDSFEKNKVNFDSLETFVDNQLIDDDINPYCDEFGYFEYSELTFKDIELLEVTVPNSGQWYENILRLSLNNKGYIEDQYKQSFSANINLIFKSNKECKFKAEIRIHGDWKDHIDVNNLTSSLDVTLLDGNILGVTKFKLFLPETRNNKNEIFVTTILRNLNFISPRTGYMNVKTNNGSVQKNIFQEKVAKEIIEEHGFREGPLLRTEGYYFWRNDQITIEESKNAFVYTKLINSSWGERSLNNISLSIEAIQKYNKAIYSSPNRVEINKSYLSRSINNISEFDAAVLALNGGHGLDQANRKFYYNKISEEFLPIYWDGNSDFIESEENGFIDNEFTRLEQRKLEDIANGALALIDRKDLNVQKIKSDLLNNNLVMTDEEIKNLTNKFYKNLQQLSKLSSNEFVFQTKIKELETTFKNINLIFLNSENKTAEICNQNLDSCSNKENFDLEKLDFDGFTYNSSNSHIFGVNKEALLERENFRERKFVDNFYVESFNNPNIKISTSTKTIEIYFENNDQKVLLSGQGEISNWKIIVNSDQNLNLLTRQDINLLTGCLTLYNLKLDNINIQSNNAFCEDAVNIVNSQGFINEIKIENSLFDGLDVDHSELKIGKINISASGNDCLDLSGGNYEIANAYLSECKDKGISVGEKSKATIDDANIIKSFIGLAVKDSSEVHAKKIKFDETKMCFALYRKKQEFGPSFLSIQNVQCKSNFDNYVQRGSLYINEN